MGNNTSSQTDSSSSDPNHPLPQPDLNLIASLQLGTAIVNDTHVVGLSDRYVPSASDSSLSATKDDKKSNRKTLAQLVKSESQGQSLERLSELLSDRNVEEAPDSTAKVRKKERR